MSKLQDANTGPNRVRLGMVGGGQGAFIGAVHRIAARIDDEYDFCAGALSSNPQRALASKRYQLLRRITYIFRSPRHALKPAYT